MIISILSFIGYVGLAFVIINMLERLFVRNNDCNHKLSKWRQKCENIETLKDCQFRRCNVCNKIEIEIIEKKLK